MSADAVIAGTPSDLSHLMRLHKPVVRARYEFAEVGEPRLSALVEAFLGRHNLTRAARIG
jgi:predicted GTPase